jgi:MFS family permease
MAATGVGSLVAALWLAFGRGARPAIIAGGALLLGLAEVALAATSSYAVALALMFLVGAGGIAMAATANTTIQVAVPDELRGRVISVYTTVFAGSSPLGGLLIGWLASVFGIAVAAAVGGGASIVVALAAFAWLRGRRPALAAPASAVRLV